MVLGNSISKNRCTNYRNYHLNHWIQLNSSMSWKRGHRKRDSRWTNSRLMKRRWRLSGKQRKEVNHQFQVRFYQLKLLKVSDLLRTLLKYRLPKKLTLEKPKPNWITFLQRKALSEQIQQIKQEMVQQALQAQPAPRAPTLTPTKMSTTTATVK